MSSERKAAQRSCANPGHFEEATCPVVRAEEEGFEPSARGTPVSESFGSRDACLANGRPRSEAARTRATSRRLRASLCGGGGGIRTHGSLSTTPVFKTGALNRSATPPRFWRRAGTWWIGARASRRRERSCQSGSAAFAGGGVHLDGSAACWGLDTYGGASPPSGTFAELGGGETSTAARSAGRAKTTRQSRRR